MDLSRLLSTGHWFNPNPGPPSMAYSVLAFVFAVLLGAGIYVYINKKRLFGEHRLKARLANQIATLGIVLGFVGLVLVVCRYLLVPYLSARFLVYVVLIALVVAIVYYVYFLLHIYPSRLAVYEAEAIRRRYLPKQIVSSGRSLRKRAKKRR